jgi:hypothetical protein
MDEPLVEFVREQMGRLLARLRARGTRTPQIDAALVRLEAATAELVAWAQTSPVRVPGDFEYTPIGPWVLAVNELQTLMDPEENDEENAVAEAEYFTPPDTPFDEWVAGVEALLAEVERLNAGRDDQGETHTHLSAPDTPEKCATWWRAVGVSARNRRAWRDDAGAVACTYRLEYRLRQGGGAKKV